MKRLICKTIASSSIPIAKRTRRALSQSRYVSASATYNFAKGDTLADWLNRSPTFGKENSLSKRNIQNVSSFSLDNTKPSSSDEDTKFVSFIKEKGNDFEKYIVEQLRKKYDVKYGGSVINDYTCKNTKDFINDRVEIIYSAPFQDSVSKTQGIIDLLIRSDILSDMINISPPQSNSSILHYVVCDIKFSTVPLTRDGIHILNQGHYGAYKHQLCIYNNALQMLQNYVPQYAYILGRRCRIHASGKRQEILSAKFDTFSPFEKVGTIDFRGHDKFFVTSTDNSIDWLRRLDEHGATWSLSPPSVKELYPNMCVHSGKWHNEKKRLADSVGEITNVWMCGVNARQNAMRAGVYSWRDYKCTAELMGFSGRQANIINKILDVNRGEKRILRTFNCQRKLNKAKCEMFIDFETFVDTDIVNPTFGEAPIFMIGIHTVKDGKKETITFCAENDSVEEEKRILTEMYNFIRKNNPTKIWYWHADAMMWNKRVNILGLDFKPLPWIDLVKIFREEPIVIKGAFGFGLKEISRAMYENGMISLRVESQCTNGLMAGISAQREYRMGRNIKNSFILQDIQKYNEFDVIVLSEILNYLRGMPKQ